ncbi:MAG: response regulator transcription factor [Chloroflexota bacterium]
MIKVLIAEDHDHLRQQLGILLDSSGWITVVGEADNGKKAVDMCAKLHPDVVLMDAHMPFMDGFTATETIRAQFPAIRVVIFSNGFLGEDSRAVQAGASAFLLKPKTTEQIIKTIRDVHADNYMQP